MRRDGFIVILTVAALIAACSSSGTNGGAGTAAPTTPSGLNPVSAGDVRITRARVFIRDGRPQAFLEGEIGDGCNSLQPITQQREGNTVDVSVTYRREGQVCTMIMQLLNQWLPLDGPFPPGAYVLRVNDQRIPFQVAGTAGAIRVEPDPGPLPQPPYSPSPR